MSITKSVRECYEVRARGEWANIALAHWEQPDMTGDGIRSVYGGEITIHSSFGTWAYTWTACAVQFKRFLCGIDFDYAFEKFMGAARDRFDGAATMTQIKRDIIKARRSGELTYAQARDVWDAIIWEYERITHGDATTFGYAMRDIAEEIGLRHPMADYFNDPCGWPTHTRYDHQATGFWRVIWPSFIAELQRECEGKLAEMDPASAL